MENLHMTDLYGAMYRMWKQERICFSSLICSVFIFTSKEELEYSIQYYSSIKDEYIKHLSASEEFSENEKEIFNKLSE